MIVDIGVQCLVHAIPKEFISRKYASMSVIIISFKDVDTTFYITIRAPNKVDIMTLNSIFVLGIDNAIGDTALEALSCWAALDP